MYSTKKIINEAYNLNETLAKDIIKIYPNSNISSAKEALAFYCGVKYNLEISNSAKLQEETRKIISENRKLLLSILDELRQKYKLKFRFIEDIFTFTIRLENSKKVLFSSIKCNKDYLIRNFSKILVNTISSYTIKDNKSIDDLLTDKFGNEYKSSELKIGNYKIYLPLDEIILNSLFVEKEDKLVSCEELTIKHKYLESLPDILPEHLFKEPEIKINFTGRDKIKKLANSDSCINSNKNLIKFNTSFTHKISKDLNMFTFDYPDEIVELNLINGTVKKFSKELSEKDLEEISFIKNNYETIKNNLNLIEKLILQSQNEIKIKNKILLQSTDLKFNIYKETIDLNKNILTLEEKDLRKLEEEFHKISKKQFNNIIKNSKYPQLSLDILKMVNQYDGFVSENKAANILRGLSNNYEGNQSDFNSYNLIDSNLINEEIKYLVKSKLITKVYRSFKYGDFYALKLNVNLEYLKLPIKYQNKSKKLKEALTEKSLENYGTILSLLTLDNLDLFCKNIESVSNFFEDKPNEIKEILKAMKQVEIETSLKKIISKLEKM